MTAPRIKAPKPKTVTKSGFIKRKYRQERELAEIHEVFFFYYFQIRNTNSIHVDQIDRYIRKSGVYTIRNEIP